MLIHVSATWISWWACSLPARSSASARTVAARSGAESRVS